jgi:hypothetical protein
MATPSLPVVTLRNITIITGVMIAPPAIRLAMIGTKVPWRYASLKEFQLIAVSPRRSTQAAARMPVSHHRIRLIAERSIER